MNDEEGNDIKKLLGITGRPGGGFGRGPMERWLTTLWSFLGIQPKTIKGIFDKLYVGLDWIKNKVFIPVMEMSVTVKDAVVKFLTPAYIKLLEVLESITNSQWYKSLFGGEERRQDKALKDASGVLQLKNAGELSKSELRAKTKEAFINQGNRIKQDIERARTAATKPLLPWEISMDREKDYVEMERLEKKFDKLEMEYEVLKGQAWWDVRRWGRGVGINPWGKESLGHLTSEYGWEKKDHSIKINDGAFIDGKMYSFNPDDTFVAMTRKPENLDSDSIIGAITSSFDKGLEGLSRVMINNQSQLAESLAQGGGSIINTSTSNTIVDNSNHTNVALMNQKSAVFG